MSESTPFMARGRGRGRTRGQRRPPRAGIPRS
jgi:hypothetical protein